MNDKKRVVAVPNLREFFRDSLDEALANQSVEAADQTSHYIVNLLTLYSRADALFDTADDRRGLKPLAFMLADALESPSLRERERSLQRLGDVALFMAGFFAHSFSRKLVDVDYYISMGGGAYGHLSETMQVSPGGAAFRMVFAELAEKFQRFVDVLNDVAEMARTTTPSDALRWYEIWLRTGSPRAAAKLRELGIHTSPGMVSRRTQ